MDELRLAVRRLMKRPASTLASIATLACAIGAAAVTWSALSGLLLYSLPVKDADTLVVAASRGTSGREAGRVTTDFVYPSTNESAMAVSSRMLHRTGARAA